MRSLVYVLMIVATTGVMPADTTSVLLYGGDSANPPRMLAADYTARVGEVIEVPVLVDSIVADTSDGIQSIQFAMRYNATMLIPDLVLRPGDFPATYTEIKDDTRGDEDLVQRRLTATVTFDPPLRADVVDGTYGGVGRVPAIKARLPLWDGELSGGEFENGVPDNTQPHTGSWSFCGTPDRSHSPTIFLNGLPSMDKDISSYDEVWFWAKTDLPGASFSFTVYSRPDPGNAVDIGPCVEGGSLSTAYKLVRIPVTKLQTDAYPLTSVQRLCFGTAVPDTTHKIWIDDVSAVKLSVPGGGSGGVICTFRFTVTGAGMPALGFDPGTCGFAMDAVTVNADTQFEAVGRAENKLVVRAQNLFYHLDVTVD